MTNQKRKYMTVKITWPELDYMPADRTRKLSGWASLKEMQQTLKRRFSHCRPELLDNGIRYFENFNAFGLKALRVFEVTLSQ